MKLVIAITGATGVQYGIRLLELLSTTGVETHLVLSNWASLTIQDETDYSTSEIKAKADHVYSNKDLAAKISSGSYKLDGMVVAPCTMKTLASIRMGLGDNLITRAADVVLKERKRLVILPREAPLNDIHLENMLGLSRAGAIIMPPVPPFYTHPKTLDDIIDDTVYRVLDLFDIYLPEADEKRWDGFKK
jgi:4-hydroxy-3-polyprenylbenzoate decarboxylase